MQPCILINSHFLSKNVFLFLFFPERALYSFECAFHPLFSLTSGTSRLDYLRPENRLVVPFCTF